jgi:Acetoacetate decarboxylase (ADC)
MSETFTVDGRTLTMPVEVRAARSWLATYVVPAEAAQRLLPPGLEVAELRPGKALVPLGFVRYADNDLGAYDEFPFAILVRRHDAPPATAREKSAEVRRNKIAAYIHRMPVNAEFSLQAGRGIWGYPKTMADFALRETGRASEWTLSEGGRMSVRLRLGPTPIPLPRQKAPPTYTYLDGVLRRTEWESSPRGARGWLRGAELTLGEGVIADELRSLGLPKKALLSSRVGNMRSRFFAPQVIATASASEPAARDLT